MTRVAGSAGPVRLSPIDAWLRSEADHFSSREDMPQPGALHANVPTGGAVTLTECSWRRRFGLKGPGAEAWLAERGFVTAAAGNSWALTDGVLVGRLATSEFLVEAMGTEAAVQDRVAAAGRTLYGAGRPTGVYPVVRQDLVLRSQGAALNDWLRQSCSVDFAPLLETAGSTHGPLVMTSMVGVGVVAVPVAQAAGTVLTLWADPSFGHYFWTTLVELAADLGGGVRLDEFIGG